MPVVGSAAGQLQEFLSVLKRRRWQIALPAIFVFTFGTAFAVVVPKKYVVDTKVQVHETRNQFDTGLRNTGDTAATRELENVEQHIINTKRIKTIVSVDLIEYWPEYQRADRDTRDDIIKAIQSNLSVSKSDKVKSVGSTFVEVTYKDVEPERATAFLARLSTIWIEEVIARDFENLNSQFEVLDEQARQARDEYSQAQTRWGELCAQMLWNPKDPPDAGGSGSGPANDVAFDQLRFYMDESERLEGEVARAEAAVVEGQALFDAEPKMLPSMESVAGESFAPQVAGIEDQISKLELQLESITTRHSDYLLLTRRIAELRDRITELLNAETEASTVSTEQPNAYKETLRRTLAESRSGLVQKETEYTRVQGKVEEYEGLVAQRSEDYNILSGLWEAKKKALKRMNETDDARRSKQSAIRLEKESGKRQYSVVSEPVASDSATEPSFLLLVAFSLFAGLAFGLGIAMLAEYGRNSYRTVAELAAVVNVPVLGAVQVIVTRPEARRTHARRAMVGVSSALILVGVAWMSYVWQNEDSQNMLPTPVLQAIESFRRSLM